MSRPPVLSLHLLRHADAGDPSAWRGDDDARPLSPRGVGQAERLARHLSRVGFRPDVILTSPKTRAAETARIVGAALALDVTVEHRLAGSVDLRLVARLLDDGGGPVRPVLVGHDPDFSELLATLVGAPRVEMKKGALARVDLADGLAPGAGVLRWLLPPDLVADA